ncbi:MAG: LemA family protein [Muribaculaceae bacterium]|nr:LemA family protein [Muribaculaceae bacterium]
MIAILVLIIIVLLIVWAISTRNKIKGLEVKIEEAKSGIDIALVKRYDILTESLNVAKGYAVHERDVLVQLVEVRRGMSLQQTREVMENQDSAIEKLKIIGEAYPSLYSNELFKELQDQIAVTNEHIGAAKRALNSNIALYNQKIVAFPASIIASTMGAGQIAFFQETDERKMRDVEMRF